jgi:hypothetical protein
MSDTTTNTTTNTAAGPSDQRSGTDRAREAVERGKHDAADVARVARSETAQLAHRTGSEARKRADEQAGNLATMLGGLADELDEVAAGSDERGGNVAGLARDGAAASRRVADRLDQEGLDGVLDDVRSFARRRPAMFLAASFGTGFILGRLMRNSDLGQIARDSRDGGSASGADEFQAMSGRTAGSGELTAPTPRDPALTGTGTTAGGQPASTIGVGSSTSTPRRSGGNASSPGAQR